MSDLIDRNDAVEAIEFEKVYMTAYKGSSNGYVSEGNPFMQYNKGLDDAIKAINSLPSAEPERKTGRWVPVDSYTAFGGDKMTWLAHGNPIAYHYCSECKNHAYALEDGEDLLSDFCPNCGAEMSRGE